MSIETLLTLGLAAAILGVAAVMRVLTFGVVRLAMAVSGKKPRPIAKGARHLAPRHRRSWGERVGPVLEGARLAAVFIAAQVGFTLSMMVSGFVMVFEWLRPRVVDAATFGAERSTTGARTARRWWRRRMIPSLHRLAIEETGATWPASFTRTSAPKREAHRVIRLDDDAPVVQTREFARR